MKKTIMFLGVLSLSVAYAQQQNDGKVGINTENPSATLNVKSKTGNIGTTKNLELENGAATKLVTVLDNGKVGIGVQAPGETLDINGNARVRSLPDGTNVGTFPYTVVSKQDGTLGRAKRHFLEYIENNNTPMRTEISKYSLPHRIVVPMYFSMDNTTCYDHDFYTYFTLYYRDGRFVYTGNVEHSRNIGGGVNNKKTVPTGVDVATIEVQGNYTDNITLTYKTKSACIEGSTVLRISKTGDGKVQVEPLKKDGNSRYFISWVPYGVQ